MPLIIGIILIVIVIYVALKILKSIIIGVVLIILVLLASFFIFGSLPSLKDIPIIGGLFPSIPTTPEGVVIAIKNILYSIDVLEVSKDSQGNLLVAIANTGKLDVSGIKIFVDNQTARIINNPKDPLKSGEATVIQTDWNQTFSRVLIQTAQVNTTYIAK